MAHFCNTMLVMGNFLLWSIFIIRIFFQVKDLQFFSLLDEGSLFRLGKCSPFLAEIFGNFCIVRFRKVLNDLFPLDL